MGVRKAQKAGMARSVGRRAPGRRVVGSVFALVLALVAVLGALAFLQERDIEHGIMEVCATQQDGYVQLVIDQINLNDNRDDEEIVADILSTLDTSANKYWVFSQDQTMLFVKDAVESNRYKEISAVSYWGNGDAAEFAASLVSGEVRHGFIELDGVEYLASGAVFSHDGRDYRLCLLTNSAALLDNNDYLGARSRLLVVMLVALGLLFIVPMTLAFVIARDRREAAARQAVIASLNARLGEASERLVHDEVYDNRRRVWSGDLLETFVDKLVERGADDAFFVQVVCDGAEEAERVIDRASIALDESVVRFRMADDLLVFLFVSGDADRACEQVSVLLGDRSRIACVASLKEQVNS